MEQECQMRNPANLGISVQSFRSVWFRADGPYRLPTRLDFRLPACALMTVHIWEFPKIRVPYFGVLIIRILLSRVLY